MFWIPNGAKPAGTSGSVNAPVARVAGLKSLSTTRTVFVASTLGFQPEIVPSSVAKMKNDLPEFAPFETTKSFVALKTSPVGAAIVPAGLPAGGATVTTSATAVPSPLYSVVTPAPLSETQNGLVDEAVMPHALTRFGSVVCANPGMFDTRFVWWTN